MKVQNMKLAKYNKKKNCMYCPACNTYEVTCEGTGTWRFPGGFGFLPGDQKFSVVGHLLKGFVGTCEHCHEEVFNYTSKRRFVNYPRSINKKIAPTA